MTDDGITFFLRFYSPKAGTVGDCLQGFRNLGHVFDVMSIDPLTRSHNPIVPTGIEVTLKFAPEALAKFKADGAAKDIYLTYAALHITGGLSRSALVECEPGDPAFKVA